MRLSVESVETPGAPEPRGFSHRARLVISPERAADRSPFLLMAEDWFAPPAGFPTHPHRGMETVTFVLEGELLHADHTGGTGRLGAGDAQFMTAGGGVMHSEMPGPNGVRTLQLWLNLPGNLKRVPARYTDMRRGDAPTFRAEGVEARVYAGAAGDVVAPQATVWPLTLIDCSLAPGAAFEIAVGRGERAFAFVLDGEVAIGPDARPVKAGQIAWIAPPEARGALRLKALGAARFLVYASRAFDEPIAMGGPFVMNTREEILEAFADLRAGRLTAAL